MKISLQKGLLTLTTGLLVLSSCVTSSDVASGGMFNKRKYNKGFHVNIPSRNQKVDKIEAVAKVEEAKATKAVANKTVSTNVKETKQVLAETTIAQTPVEKVLVDVSSESNKTEANQNLPVYSKKTTTVKQRLASKVVAKQATKMMKNENNSQKKGDIDPIVYIILCILISPVAVGLATDWDIMRVIFNLLWCLTCIGGIIHAFYVCNKEGVI